MLVADAAILWAILVFAGLKFRQGTAPLFHIHQIAPHRHAKAAVVGAFLFHIDRNLPPHQPRRQRPQAYRADRAGTAYSLLLTHHPFIILLGIQIEQHAFVLYPHTTHPLFFLLQQAAHALGIVLEQDPVRVGHGIDGGMAAAAAVIRQHDIRCPLLEFSAQQVHRTLRYLRHVPRMQQESVEIAQIEYGAQTGPDRGEHALFVVGIDRDMHPIGVAVIITDSLLVAAQHQHDMLHSRRPQGFRGVLQYGVAVCQRQIHLYRAHAPGQTGRQQQAADAFFFDHYHLSKKARPRE